MPLDRPIPAFYCCYLLRSTIRPSRLYVGSTPKPSTRLKQHNGIIKGGAVKTSRDNLRPWEMTAIVTGFPSQIAALQFEWAWQNPHLTHHIPADSRISFPTEKKKSGRPKRPRYSLAFLLSNLHVLLGVPSFSRWPLQLRFFSRDVYQSWIRCSSEATNKLRSTLPVVLDFPEVTNGSASATEIHQEASLSSCRTSDLLCPSNQGLAALEVDYSNHKAHFEKSKSIVDFEVEGSCSVCDENLVHNAGIYVICPHQNCKSVSHLSCLSRHFLAAENQRQSDEDDKHIVPVEGNCPSCGGIVKWIDVVKEMTLRMRGGKEAEKILKKPRTRVLKENAKAGKGKKGEAEAPILFDAEANGLDEDYDWANELDAGEDDAKFGTSPEAGGRWHSIDNFDDDDDDDTISITSEASAGRLRSPERTWKRKEQDLDIVIEDTDWDEADVLD